jgi:tripartite-type tricarboxylate transporter receptor subunit TctC
MSVSHTMSAAVYEKLPFDPVKSFTPVATLGAGPLVLVTHPAFSAGTVKALIELAQAKPNTLTYSSAGHRRHQPFRRRAVLARGRRADDPRSL